MNLLLANVVAISQFVIVHKTVLRFITCTHYLYILVIFFIVYQEIVYI